MTNTVLTETDLAHFTGSETWYKHGLNRRVTFTEGAKYVADKAGAHWLIDEIALAQMGSNPVTAGVAAEEFQVWKLAVHENRSATLTCDDGNGNIVYTKPIEFTDFPLPAFTFWFENGVIYLPSER